MLDIPARRRIRERDRQRDLFQNYYILVERRAGRRTSHVALVYSVDSHAIIASVVASHVACLIVHAFAFVCFEIPPCCFKVSFIANKMLLQLVL